MNAKMTRRDGLMTALFGTGYIGLRALATGLPVWYLLDPHKATAQDLQCLVSAQANLQYLILSTSSMGDPINCNCPGTYEAANAIHPQQAEVAATQVTLGGKTFGAALPWAPTASGGALDPAVLARTSFFHHTTGSTIHGDQPKVMKLLGDLTGGEMFASAVAKHLSSCFATIQAEPIALGAGSNASELVSFSGRTLASIRPTQLKQLLTGSKTDPLVKLQSLRDSSLSQLNALAKQSGNMVQQQFLDTLATSQTQVRALATTLANTLSSISDDGVTGQSLAAAALIAANVTPVVTMHIPFGGDNHSDQNLQTEADQTVSGVKAIQTLMTDLANLGLTDKVTFATWNVFGRNLNGIAKVTSRAGRDHYGNHAVTVMIGKNVAPGVIGGITPDSSGAYVASPIDSSSGAASSSGDIGADATHVSLARTLAGALGIPASVAGNDFITSAGGKLVAAALTTVP
ncbi:MAG TPA: DUF1501 domain-containing protein [Polyangiaceae bacterium]|nr:DUF1501 domain-containing protein [Polyangiaceae bacterium]